MANCNALYTAKINRQGMNVTYIHWFKCLFLLKLKTAESSVLTVRHYLQNPELRQAMFACCILQINHWDTCCTKESFFKNQGIKACGLIVWFQANLTCLMDKTSVYQYLLRPNLNQSDQWTIRCHKSVKLLKPKWKAFSTILCASFNAETLSSSDLADALAAFTLTSLGGTCCCQ